MWNIYVIVTGKYENKGDLKPNISDKSVNMIQIMSNKILKNFTQYSNWIWVDSSLEAMTTGVHLKRQMMENGKISDFYVEQLLDSEENLQLFIDKRLKQLACKNNVIIVSEDICKKLIELLNGGNVVESRDIYHFKYDRLRKSFTLCKN